MTEKRIGIWVEKDREEWEQKNKAMMSCRDDWELLEFFRSGSSRKIPKGFHAKGFGSLSTRDKGSRISNDAYEKGICLLETSLIRVVCWIIQAQSH